MDNGGAKSFGAGGSADASAALFGRCPAHWMVRQIGDRWSLPVLSLLSGGPLRYSQLRHALSPISPRMLGRTLKRLVSIGLARRVPSGTPPQIHYELTELGRSVAKPIGRLFAWSKENIASVEQAKAASGKPAGQDTKG